MYGRLFQRYQSRTYRYVGVRIDILPALKGEDSHRRSHTAGGCVGSSRFAHRRGAGHAKWPLLLSSTRPFPSFPRGFGRASPDSEVLGCFASVPDVSRWGTSGLQSGTPRLSDCPGMGADVPRRMNRILSRGHLNLPIRTFATDDGDSSPPSRAGLSRLQSRNRWLLRFEGPLSLSNGPGIQILPDRRFL